MSAVQLSTASYVHLFVFFLLAGVVWSLRRGFNPAWFGHYGFLEDEGLVRQAGEKHLRCAPFGWCSERRPSMCSLVDVARLVASSEVW
jgi:hypothetical protein